jgi:hypothetical protein
LYWLKIQRWHLPQDKSIIGPYALQFLICDTRWVCRSLFLKSVHKQFCVTCTFIFRKRIWSVTFLSLVRFKIVSHHNDTLFHDIFVFVNSHTYRISIKLLLMINLKKRTDYEQ